MRNETLWPFLRKRVRAFLGATTVVTVLWLVTVLAVKVFVAPSRFDGQGLPLSNTSRFAPGGAIEGIGKKDGSRLFFLHRSIGDAFGFGAWHKVALVLILVTLTALAVAFIDWLRRKSRRSRRARTI